MSSPIDLPKDVIADPRHEALSKLLGTTSGLLWEKGRVPVATLPVTPALAAELGQALTTGLACQGLELAAEKLGAEQKGLDAVARKDPAAAGKARISRVLFIAGDGSTRFHRDAEALLVRYSQRLLGVRLDTTGEALGEALFGAPKLVRAVLVVDKRAAARALLSLVG